MAHAAEPLDRAKISAPEKNKNGTLFRGDEWVWLLSFDSLLLGIPFLSHLSFVNSNASGQSQNSVHFFLCFRQEISEGNDIIGARHLIAFD
jgi:hypothetical protein